MSAAEAARSYLESFATADPDVIASWVTDDFVNEHTAALGGGCVGREAYRQRLPGFLGGFEGLAYGVETIVAEGDQAMVAYTMRARFRGDPVEVRGVQRLVVRDGKIAHRVDYWDSLQFLLQVDPSVRDALSAWLP